MFIVLIIRIKYQNSRLGIIAHKFCCTNKKHKPKWSHDTGFKTSIWYICCMKQIDCKKLIDLMICIFWSCFLWRVNPNHQIFGSVLFSCNLHSNIARFIKSFGPLKSKKKNYFYLIFMHFFSLWKPNISWQQIREKTTFWRVSHDNNGPLLIKSLMERPNIYNIIVDVVYWSIMVGSLWSVNEFRFSI